MARRPLPPLDPDDYRRLAAFRHTLRRFLHFSESAAARMGVTGQQYHALLAVRASAGGRPLTINDLAGQLLIKHNSAVGLVDRLAEQGLLVRKPAQDDARKVNLALTAKGARVLGRLAGSHWEELGRVGTQLRELLRQIAGS
ncbi:MAG TPA: MarR family transcriptional regulator [Myxococcales bacterium]|nr:MarR family transcriptional regulator [Myxococcales bacterium]